MDNDCSAENIAKGINDLAFKLTELPTAEANRAAKLIDVETLDLFCWIYRDRNLGCI